jgi:adenylate cyclase
MERRLAAIVAADMVGFSSQMQRDETGTLARLKRVRAEIIDPQISINRGRIFKTMGDGFLAEFAVQLMRSMLQLLFKRRLQRIIRLKTMISSAISASA